jgi:hypothetical protein
MLVKHINITFLSFSLVSSFEIKIKVLEVLIGQGEDFPSLQPVTKTLPAVFIIEP